MRQLHASRRRRRSAPSQEQQRLLVRRQPRIELVETSSELWHDNRRAEWTGLGRACERGNIVVIVACVDASECVEVVGGDEQPHIRPEWRTCRDRFGGTERARRRYTPRHVE